MFWGVANVYEFQGDFRLVELGGIYCCDRRIIYPDSCAVVWVGSYLLSNEWNVLMILIACDVHCHARFSSISGFGTRDMIWPLPRVRSIRYLRYSGQDDAVGLRTAPAEALPHSKLLKARQLPVHRALPPGTLTKSRKIHGRCRDPTDSEHRINSVPNPTRKQQSIGQRHTNPHRPREL